VAKDGDLQKGAQESHTLFDTTYLNDYVAHAPMEPHAAVVSLEGNKARVWASTQTPFMAKEEVAKELGIPAKDVRIMPVYVGAVSAAKATIARSLRRLAAQR